jgi:hypothetical protein
LREPCCASIRAAANTIAGFGPLRLLPSAKSAIFRASFAPWTPCAKKLSKTS